MRHFYVLTFLTALFANFSLSAQTITTIAGTGYRAGTGFGGYTGDGGAATNAQLAHPYGIAFDAGRNLYIADGVNHCVRKVTPAGIITTIAGTGTAGHTGDGGPATAATCRYPHGIVIDPDGSIIFTENGNHCIRKIAPSGIISTIAGTGLPVFSGDGGPATAAGVIGPGGICRDGAGNLYYCDGASSSITHIRKIDPAGIITTVAGSGASTYSGDGLPATDAGFSSPTDITLDASGNLLFTSWGDHRIRKIGTDGIISTIAGVSFSGYGGEGLPATATQLNYPAFLAVDTIGNIIFSDQINHRLRKINTSGLIVTVAGNGTMAYAGDGGPATAANLNSPMGVHISGNGVICFADMQNNVVRKITMNGPKFTCGALQRLQACINDIAVPVNILLAVTHNVAGPTDTWSVAAAPAHGALTASYATVATGGILLPTGLSYTPATGYSGPDTFSVRVTDGAASDTTFVYVQVSPLPDAGVVTGDDTLCFGDTLTFASTTPAGRWISALPTIASVTPAGHVRTLSLGEDTILYVYANYCGADTTRYPLAVVDCSLETPVRNTAKLYMTLYPNPASETLTIATTAANGTVTLTDMVGRQLARRAVVSTISELDVHNLPSGIYVAEWKHNGGTVSQKIAIR